MTCVPSPCWAVCSRPPCLLSVLSRPCYLLLHSLTVSVGFLLFNWRLEFGANSCRLPFSIYFQKKKHASKSEFPPRVQVLWRILQAPPDSLLALLVFSCLLRDSSDVLVPGIWGKWKCLQGSPGHKTLMGCRVTLTHGIDQSAVFRKSLQSPEITFYFKTHSVTLVTHCRVTLGNGVWAHHLNSGSCISLPDTCWRPAFFRNFSLKTTFCLQFFHPRLLPSALCVYEYFRLFLYQLPKSVYPAVFLFCVSPCYANFRIFCCCIKISLGLLWKQIFAYLLFVFSFAFDWVFFLLKKQEAPSDGGALWVPGRQEAGALLPILSSAKPGDPEGLWAGDPPSFWPSSVPTVNGTSVRARVGSYGKVISCFYHL